MPEFRERPKLDKLKTRPSTPLSPGQAAKVLRDRYVKQLDQRPKENGSETNEAVDQVETAGQWGIDHAVPPLPHRRRQSKNPLKERRSVESRSDPAKSETPQTGELKLRDRPKSRPKEREAAGPGTKAKPQTRQRPASTFGQHTDPIIRERDAQPVRPSVKGTNQAVPRMEDKKAMLEGQRQHRALRHELPVDTQEGISSLPEYGLSSRYVAPTDGGISKGGSTLKVRPRPAGAFRERTSTIFKTRSGSTVKPSPPHIKVKLPETWAAKKAARQSAQRQMAQRMTAQARKAACAAMTTAKKASEAVVRAAAALASGLAGLLGGGVLAAILLLVAVVAAVASSPFGLFFTEEPNAPDTLSAAGAVAAVSREYTARLEELQDGDYDGIDVAGQPP